MAAAETAAFAATRLEMQQTIAALWARMREAQDAFNRTSLDDPKRDVKRTDYESAARRFREQVPIVATAIRALSPIDPDKPASKRKEQVRTPT